MRGLGVSIMTELRRGVSISVYDYRHRILTVTNRRFGGFTLPGGKVEKGELPDQAAFRELYEETGLKPDALIYLGCSMFDNPFTDDEPFLVSHYEAIINHPKPKVVEQDTIPTWRSAHELYRDERSIFADHYRKIAELDIIKTYGPMTVMD